MSTLNHTHIKLLNEAKELLVLNKENYIYHAIKHADIGYSCWINEANFSVIATELLEYVNKELDKFNTLVSYLCKMYKPLYENYDDIIEEITNFQHKMRICWIERIIYLIEENKIEEVSDNHGIY